MNKIIPIIALLMISCKNMNSQAEKTLDDLFESRNFFKLRHGLDSLRNQLPKDKILYYESHILNAFGECEKSNRCIEQTLSKHKLQESVIADFLELQANNYSRLHMYGRAADIYSTLLSDYAHLQDSAENVENYKLYSLIADVAPQKIHKNADVTIKTHRNDFNHQILKVACNGVSEDFVFDTGAGLSVITASYALKMGMRLYKSNIKVVTSTDIKIEGAVAVADSFYVGDLMFENVIFLVFPDEQLSFPQVNYSINGIIGFPVIRQMEEIRIKKDGTLFIPKVVENKQIQNLFFYGSTPIASLKSNNEDLLFSFDTGASHSELSSNYYKKHKGWVEQNAELSTQQRGGGGGVISAETYVLKQDFAFAFGNKSVSLQNLSVNIDDYKFAQYWDGNLGQDVFSQFDEMTINFKYMFLDFN